MAQKIKIGLIEQVVNFPSVDFKKDSRSGCKSRKPEQHYEVFWLSLILIPSYLFKRNWGLIP